MKVLTHRSVDKLFFANFISSQLLSDPNKPVNLALQLLTPYAHRSKLSAGALRLNRRRAPMSSVRRAISRPRYIPSRGPENSTWSSVAATGGSRF